VVTFITCYTHSEKLYRSVLTVTAKIRTASFKQLAALNAFPRDLPEVVTGTEVLLSFIGKARIFCT
jgi:hypothetical protein